MKRGTVLVVNNDPLLAQKLVYICRSLGVEATVCDDVTAIERFDQIRPALVCVDASTELSSGDSLTQHFDIDPQLSSIPIVILTDPGQCAIFRFPPDMCVYCLGKGTRLFPAWKAVLEELLDITPALPKSAPVRSLQANAGFRRE